MAHDVFISYSNDDEAAAKRLIDGLTSRGVRVWHDLDRSETGNLATLRIAHHIAHCRMFLPIISQATNRGDGYYRQEWNQAADRARSIDRKKKFILPVVIDNTKFQGARVPPEFFWHSWHILLGGQPTKNFVGELRKLLA